MFKLRPSVIASLALCSSLGFAGTMGQIACVKESLTLPCECQAWTFAGRALYLQANTSPHNDSENVLLSPFLPFTNEQLNNKWGFGFQLEAGYNFTPSNDINVNWYHYRNTTNKFIPAKTIFSTYIASTLYDSISTNNAFYSLNPQWDQVNIELAKRFELGSHDTIRAHGGFNYSRVANNGDQSYGGTADLAFPTTLVIQENRYETYSTTFNGFGVRTGFDLNHCFNQMLSIYATGAASLLAGSNHTNLAGTTTFSFNSVNGPLSRNTNSSRNLVVPELDAKAGINLRYSYSQDNSLTADVGWLWANYFGALNNGVSRTDFGIQGLYFGLKYQGNLI